MKIIIKYVTLLFLIFVSGCTAEYTVNFDNQTFEAESLLLGSRKEFNEKTKNKIKIDLIADVLYHVESARTDIQRNFISNNQKVGYKYKDTFKMGEIEFWPSYSQYCYDTIESFVLENSVVINTSDQFLCFDKYTDLESVKINLKTPYLVKNHNADKVSKNVYTWHITKENSTHKPISVEINFEENGNKAHKKKEQFPLKLYIIGTICITIVGFVIYLLHQKIKKNRSI